METDMNERTMLRLTHQLIYTSKKLRVQHEQQLVLESEILMVRSEHAHLKELLAKASDDIVKKANSYGELVKDIASSELTVVRLQRELEPSYVEICQRHTQPARASKVSEFVNDVVKDLSSVVPTDAPSTTLPVDSTRNVAREERTDLPSFPAEGLGQFAGLSAPSDGRSVMDKESLTGMEQRIYGERCHAREPKPNEVRVSLPSTRTSPKNMFQDADCPLAAYDGVDNTKQALAQGTGMAWDPDHLRLVEALRRGDNSWAGQSAEWLAPSKTAGDEAGSAWAFSVDGEVSLGNGGGQHYAENLAVAEEAQGWARSSIEAESQDWSNYSSAPSV